MSTALVAPSGWRICEPGKQHGGGEGGRVGLSDLDGFIYVCKGATEELCFALMLVEDIAVPKCSKCR